MFENVGANDEVERFVSEFETGLVARDAMHPEIPPRLQAQVQGDHRSERLGKKLGEVAVASAEIHCAAAVEPGDHSWQVGSPERIL
jgi:hypothetical protein